MLTGTSEELELLKDAGPIEKLLEASFEWHTIKY